MIYVFDDENGEKFTVRGPDDINHEMVKDVLMINEEGWQFKEMARDETYIADDEHNDLFEILPPNLFINRNDETSRLEPDMDYLDKVDKKFMQDMLYYWSETGRVDYIKMCDEIEDNLDELLDSCSVIDILT